MEKEVIFKRQNTHLSNSDVENECNETVDYHQPAAKKVKHAMEPNRVDFDSGRSCEDNRIIQKMVDNLDNIFSDDDDAFGLELGFPENSTLYTLDLSTWKRCKIVSIMNQNQAFVMVVEEKNNELKAKCVVHPPWATLQFQEGDTISLYGVYDSITNSYQITSEDGMVVTDPDYLVSGTSVVGALYCQRRGVLQERFRSIDLDSKIMTIGTIVHELLQKTLRNKLTNIEDIVQLGKEYINSKEMVNMLYACQMSKSEAAKEIEPFYTKIHDFLKKHVYNQSSSFKSEIHIHAIKDIEENIWCHQLGLKGKIDVTVEAKCDNSEQVQLMPLELKTGRASFSAEHKGQIALYEMMMNVVGYRVKNGILLYLREGKCQLVSSNRNIRRDLIMLRNEVAYYLSRGLSKINHDDSGISNNVLLLPDPLNNQHVCSRCPYSVICTAFLKHEKKEISGQHSIKLISADSLKHLTDVHIDYFIRWVGLIFLEDQQAKRNFQAKHLWTKSPTIRHKSGRAAINLRLVGRVFRAGDECFHTFAVDSNETGARNDPQMHVENLSQYFEVNEYLICSTDTRVAVAAGRVVGVGRREITMSFERDLSENYLHEFFHLDKYESHTSTIFNLTNVGVLLEHTERSEALRRIIIDRESPTFTRTVPVEVASLAKQILKDLNKHQKIAVLTAIGTESFCLFKGLPGTGKTKTVIALIRLLVAMDKTVLVTSNTHSAVDNVLKRLIPHNIKFLRLGSISRIDSSLKECAEEILTENCSTTEELTAVYNSYKVVGVTCLGSAHPLLVQKRFDFCIVDEATQVFQCAILRPLLSSDKFILIGDPDQLPPVIISREAKDLGAEESLFFRLDTEQSCCVLPTQYRMNKTITRLANDFSYKGKLLCANETVANAALKLPNVQIMQKKHKLEKWLLRATASQLELSVVLINTLNTFKSSKAYDTGKRKEYCYKANAEVMQKAIYENYCEAAITLYIIMALIESGLEGSSIGVIAPYRAQVELLRYYLQLLRKLYENENETLSRNLDIEVNTVDQYQGKDKDVILYSCTRSSNPDMPNQTDTTTSDYEILQDNRRLTVAITRAKKKLIIIGDAQSLEAYAPFKNLFQSISPAGKITLQDRSFGFEWSGVFNTLDALHDCEK
ncbi:DNA replication ATP-dependent helicase/nuclease DNA2 isoform X2 [Malaya genurostris]|uniref:DNA replication ATP-dependent helicase/nuclease DNA2 isoform X2 n=1 Tax=Malaya genurostris TaxID=325434 RepID=UPI0026F3F431|nr:DNA replication ATP-dependent helicase/nuclease DNA2 isoform X2 [Malaya genurostris]